MQPHGGDDAAIVSPPTRRVGIRHMDSGARRWSRRAVLFGAGAAGVAGLAACAGARDDAAPAPGTPTESPTPPSPASTVPSAPSTPESPDDPAATPTSASPTTEAPYVPDAGEIRPAVKRAAGRFVQALAAAASGLEVAEAVAAALTVSQPAGVPPVRPDDPAVGRLVEEAGLLHRPGRPARATIVYPQLSGLQPPEAPLTAGVMVVCRQRFADGTVVTRAVDVRLEAARGGWRVADMPSAGGRSIGRPGRLSATAAAVLDDPRIELPDSARWDIHSGAVDGRLLATMRAMAERFPYGVTCLRTGHPIHVFGTDRVSHHTEGRAADVWRVGDRAVALQQPAASTPAYELNRWLAADGAVDELGGPWCFPAPVGRSFTNEVHLDHLHVGFAVPR